MSRSILAAVAVLLFAPLAAADQPTRTEQPLFLEGTNCALDSAAAPAVEAQGLAGESSEPLWMTHCSASQNCSWGGGVYCEGHTSCTVQTESVTCDGVTEQCFACEPPDPCRDPFAYCTCLQTTGQSICQRDHCMMCPFPITPSCT
jgi:hypothetical protein